MKELNRVISYWYDCIKNEDILERDISIHVRSKAVLYPFDTDPFIFDRIDDPILPIYTHLRQDTVMFPSISRLRIL